MTERRFCNGDKVDRRAEKKVIETRHRNLLVSAAAGSGKTAVLVERIIRMITDPEHPVDIDKLLVMTFTNAAAAEMRERVETARSFWTVSGIRIWSARTR